MGRQFLNRVRALRWLGLACGLLLAWLAAPVVAAEKMLEIGVLPNVSARLLMEQYEPVQTYLTRRLTQPVAVSTAPDWREFYQRVKRGDYQVVIAAANVARLIEKDLGYKPLLAYEPKIPALLIGLRGGEGVPEKLLRGRTVAMANPASLVVFEGLHWLGKQGLEAGRDFQTLTVRRDDSVGGALLRGEAVAGILSMGELRAHPEAQREQLAIIATMAEVPSFLVYVHKSLAPDLTARLRTAMLGMAQDEDGKQFFARSGFRAIVATNERDLIGLDAYVDKTRKALD